MAFAAVEFPSASNGLFADARAASGGVKLQAASQLIATGALRAPSRFGDCVVFEWAFAHSETF